MPAVVSLRDVVEALDLPGDDWTAYLDPDTGEVVIVTDEDRLLAEDGDSDDLPEWQREVLPKVREAVESDRFLQLPDPFEIHEWSIMERFAMGRENARQRDELLEAIHGSGALLGRHLFVREVWNAGPLGRMFDGDRADVALGVHIQHGVFI